jgi:hypothetical protein
VKRIFEIQSTSRRGIVKDRFGLRKRVLGFGTLAMVGLLGLLSACGGGGGGVRPAIAGWKGTKQLGAAGALTQGTAVAVDTKNGYVYVAGDTRGGLDGNTPIGNDFFLAKFDAAGAKLGTKQLGVAGTTSVATATAVDTKNGYVYVVGYTYGGLDGNSLVGLYDAFLTTYDAAGNKLSTRQLGAVGAHTLANGVAVGLDGSVYVAGNTDGGLDGNGRMGKQDCFLATYNSAGVSHFTNQLGVAGGNTWGNGVGVDSSGYVYVVGCTDGGLDGNKLTGRIDSFLSVYFNSSKVLTRQVGVAGAMTLANGVAVAANGEVYVAGTTSGGLSGNAQMGVTDFFMTKFDAAVVPQYTLQLGAAGAQTEGTRVALDASNNVYVTGDTNGALDGNAITGTYDYFLAKFNSTGSKQYLRQVGVAGAMTTGNGVATDAGGNVYVAGQTQGGLDGNKLAGTWDAFVTKYDSAGNKQ